MPRKVFRLSDSLGSMTLDAQQHEIAHLQAANRELKEAVRSLSSGQVAHTLMAEDLDAAKAEVARLEGRVRELEVERDSLRTYYESTAPFLRRLRRPRYDVDETDEYVNGSTECKRAIVALGEIVAAVGPLPPAEGEEPT